MIRPKNLKPILTIAFACIVGLAFGQTGGAFGFVKDSVDQTPLVGVSILLQSNRDTTTRYGTVSDPDGKFNFSGVRFGRYTLKITYIGYTNVEKRIFINSNDVDLGSIRLAQATTLLKGVEVTATQYRVEQKGDTIQFNASAFKTHRDATAEDLLTKMPGVTSDATGVKAQGESVQQILVDGKPFFGDDPNIALKNLPAEVIDKIEVFDRLSEQSQFTGFDDGQTRKTINIVTKKGMSNGQFGRVYAGAGENGRYIAGGNINAFKGDRKLSAIALTNNINQQNFSNEDLLGVTGSTSSQSNGGGRGNRGGGNNRGSRDNGGSNNNFMVGQQNGISTTHALGLNYSNNFGKKVELTGSYFFNYTDNDRITALERLFITTNPSDSGLFYTESNEATSKNFNHRVNARLEYNIDSANSLVITPVLSQQRNESLSTLNGEYSKLEMLEQTITNRNGSLNDGYNFTGGVLYRHRFKKRGRSFSLNMNMNLNDRDGNTSQNSYNETFSPDTVKIQDQISDQVTSSDTYSSTLALTERLGKTGQLQFNYTISLTESDTDKKTFDRNPETSGYTMLNTLLTNTFSNSYLSNRGGVSYRFNNKKYNMMAGLNFQHASLKSDQVFPSEFELGRTFQNLLPQAMFNYRFSQGENLRISYRTSTNAPSVSQLQNVVNNRNPLFLRSGNSNLEQDYQHTLTMRYGKTNSKNSSSFLLFVYGNFVQDYIGNATFIASEKDTVVNGVPLDQGTQLTYPVNVTSNWNARTFVTFGMPVAFIKSNMNLNTGFNYNRTPALINSTINLAHNYTLSQGIVIGSNHEKIDFTFSYTGNYVIVKNSLQKQSDNNYFNQVSSMRLTWQPWKGLIFSSNIVNSLYRGLGAAYNQNIWFWNASIGYKLLKDQALELKVTAFDLLRQNNSINREVTETFIEDSQTNVLTRYFMFMVTYNLRNFKVN
jgi:hypothetical protein